MTTAEEYEFAHVAGFIGEQFYDSLRLIPW